MTKVSLVFFLIAATALAAFAQPERSDEKQKVRTVSIPISIFTQQELKEGQSEEFLQVDRLTVTENREEQTILSIRSITEAPLSLAILVQDDLTSNFNLQIKDLKEFIRKLPKGSRVMVSYLRGGRMEIRQRFTTDLERAANSLRIVTGSDSVSPRSPYDGVIDTLDRFDALPAGRRAILLISDGLDSSEGTSPGSSLRSTDLERSIRNAQRKNVAIFAFWSPTVSTDGGSSQRLLEGQGSLQRLVDQTGGRAFFQGSIAPVSFDPFFRQLNILLNRQFLLTYLSTNMKKGYYRVEVTSTNPTVKVEHPKGYFYRR
ncbi:MAG: hypothetical protein QUS14_08465 [Pyrinomonadaceae bacterium]|nr:hypothetical protein [Pyrinomonadaceae bacterium]